MDNDHLELDFFAADLYIYIMDNRMGINHIPTVLPGSMDKVVFTEDIGKAVLFTCWCKHKAFYRKFTADRQDFSKNRIQVLRYCLELGCIITLDGDFEPIETLFLMSAMVAELFAFCIEQHIHVPLWYADYCWTSLFRSRINSHFPKDGWCILRKKAQKYADEFDKNEDVRKWLQSMRKTDRVIGDNLSSFTAIKSEGGRETVVAELESIGEGDRTSQLNKSTDEASASSFLIGEKKFPAEAGSRGAIPKSTSYLRRMDDVRPGKAISEKSSKATGPVSSQGERDKQSSHSLEGNIRLPKTQPSPRSAHTDGVDEIPAGQIKMDSPQVESHSVCEKEPAGTTKGKTKSGRKK